MHALSLVDVTDTRPCTPPARADAAQAIQARGRWQGKYVHTQIYLRDLLPALAAAALLGLSASANCSFDAHQAHGCDAEAGGVPPVDSAARRAPKHFREAEV